MIREGMTAVGPPADPGPDFDRLWAITVRWVSMLVGLAILIYEVFVDGAERPWLLACAMGMLGTPVAIGAERVAQEFGWAAHHVVDPVQDAIEQLKLRYASSRMELDEYERQVTPLLRDADDRDEGRLP